MARTPEQVVRASFDAFHRQDLAAVRELLDEEMTFTSPQDDHIDKATYLARCFPTRDHFAGHRILRTATAGEDVFVMYEYDLAAGGRFRNSELITVRNGRITRIQVFFGGREPG